ncbi:MAG: 4Fe-4S dicluster domain-containing protein, partial [Clostridiales bacterium]|nr:4Fe-4S dicluster domain-containing protein [Clostridiales bacterium]
VMKERLEPFRRPEFDVFRGKISTLKWRTLSLAKWFFDRKPVITKKKCVRCGACVEACPLPEKAVTFVNGKTDPPVYDYKKCIRCFCCQEMCPAKAIDAKVPVIARPFLK